MAEKVIVLRNGEYFIEEKISDHDPRDIILSYPSHAASKSIILKNLVKITLHYPWDYGIKDYKITTTYRDSEINVMYGVMQQVLSNILTFKDCSKSELDNIIKNINEDENNKSISTFENRIEELKTEKSNLENQVKELKKIKHSADKIIEFAEIFKNAIETTNLNKSDMMEK